MPDEKIAEPDPTESELDMAQELQGEKLMLQLRFEAKMFNVTKRFGENTLREVLSATKGSLTCRAFALICPMHWG
eukprot:4796804-Amphidinium_carterae.1